MGSPASLICVCVCVCHGLYLPTGSEWSAGNSGSYKNDEKKDGLPDLWQCSAFSPSGSRSCSFTTHQTWPYLLDTGALDQTCIFFSHQVEGNGRLEQELTVL